MKHQQHQQTMKIPELLGDSKQMILRNNNAVDPAVFFGLAVSTAGCDGALSYNVVVVHNSRLKVLTL
jgi:hypothetical protein